VGVALFAKGGQAKTSRVQNWQMMPSNPW